MPIADLDHAYRFPDTDDADRRYVEDRLDIAEHRDYTGVAAERIMDPDRRTRYENGAWEMQPAASFPAEETTWIGARKVLEHDLATTDPDDPVDAYFLAKNAEMSVLDARSEAVSELASLPENRVYMSETLVLPYGDREAEMSRFVPNIVWHSEPDELTDDATWQANADEALHDFLAFNYWVDNDTDGAANYALTPDANVVIFDQHPPTVGSPADDLTFGFGDRRTPDVRLYSWDQDAFERSAAKIGAVPADDIRDTVADIRNGGLDHTLAGADDPIYDLEGLLERRDVLQAVASE